MPPTGIDEWDAFFTKALARASTQRFKDGAEMEEALEQLQQSFGYSRPDDLAEVVAGVLKAKAP